MSTQDELRSLWKSADASDLAQDQKKILWLRAAEQSAGRGRQGAAWLGERGNLYISAAFRWRLDPPVCLQLLPLLAAQSAAQALAERGLWKPDCFIKWPNDLCSLSQGHSLKKWGGILVEGSLKSSLVCGWGINLASHPEEVPHAGSVAALSEGAQSTSSAGAAALPSAESLAESLRTQFEKNLQSCFAAPEAFATELLEDLENHWMQALWGMQGTYRDSPAVARGLGPRGELRIEHQGREVLASSGEFKLW